MKQRFSPVLLGAVVLVLVSCPNPFQGKDLRSQIVTDVAVATAAEHSLTVEASPYGVVSTAGAQVVKDNMPVTLDVTAFPAYGVIGWKQTAGPGNVKFTKTAAGVTAVLTGGNASVAAILVEKPKVLYSTPVGNNIAKNAMITAYFSRQVDFDTINLGTFKVLRNGSDQVTAGQFSITSDGKSVRFDPASNLSPFCNYVITVSPTIRAVLDLAEYQQGNTLITNPGLAMGAEYTGAFMTNNDADNIPPVSGNFAVTSAGGDPCYTGSSSVLLTNVYADDASGVSLALVKNELDAAYQVFTYDPAHPTIPWSVALSPQGIKNIAMAFEDPYGNRSVPDTVKSIIVDAQAPTGTITVNGAGGFVAAATVTLALSATDPDVQAGVIKGSGESTNGTDTADRKQMRFSNSPTDISSASWEAYAASRAGWALSDAAEGLKTVYAQFVDAVGNMSATFSGQVYLDPTPPTGSFTILDGGLVTRTESVVLAMTAADGSGSGVDTVRIDAGSNLQSGSTWSMTTGTGTWSGSAAADYAWPANGPPIGTVGRIVIGACLGRRRPASGQPEGQGQGGKYRDGCPDDHPGQDSADRRVRAHQ